ncbi:HU family DNA-binding protein [Parabacteroides sp. AF17-28]|uniref:HU family DNA-binding protein n=1 Tax=Parabacteroides sp. AF17-28 TaxID=2292241 RepID=UPI000EFFD392|nr:HU family DNA-binding protein [Parabacteroides sp. AF17-28]RHR51840.1 HU family DNA-binding protein [Parabacteroides sp. AF17-28]
MNNRLTIQDLAGLLAEYTGKDKNSTERFLREFIAVVSDGVYADKLVKVKGLGTFKIIPVEKRESIHVNTGERFVIPEHYKFSFLPDKDLRELVNKPFSFFETTELGENVDFTDMDVSADGTEEKETEDESVEEVMPEEKRLPQERDVSQEDSVPVEQPDSSLEEPAAPFPHSMRDREETDDIVLDNTDNNVAPDPVEAEDRQPLCDPASGAGTGKSRTKRNMAICVFVLFLIAFNVCLYLNRSHFFEEEKETSVLKEDTTSSKEDKSWMLKPEEVKKRMGVAQVDSVRQDTTQVTTQTTEAKPETTSPKVIARVKIEPGSRLTLISLDYYGSKIFWVYLYEHNKAIIKDPNNIPIGTVIEVPAPELYGINRRDRASVEKAAARQTEILSGQL